MKVLVAYCLACIVLVQSLLPRTATDLLHSPEVWAHFKEHKQETPAPLSFWEFLWMHYSADSTHTKQTKHHLPSMDVNGTAGLCVLPIAILSFESNIPVFFSKETNFQWLNSYAFLSFKALICPPRA